MQIWNVSVKKNKERNILTGYQFKSETIDGAIAQGKEFGVVVKVILAELDNDE